MSERRIAFSGESLRGWGMLDGGTTQVARPTTAEEVGAAIEQIGALRGSLGLRGAGCSYGDASLNTDGHLLDTSGMNRILAFDRGGGVMTVEPGVTIRDLWRVGIGAGWWPAVVPGTMAVSVGGAAALNIHGKNNFTAGSFGEHVESFVLRTPAAGVLRCSRNENADVFHAAIGGFGMLGCFLEISLRLKRVYSGRLRVWGIPVRDLAHSLRLLEDLRGTSDYLVGWTDLHAKGAALGRGLLHRAQQLAADEDADGARLLDAKRQDVPPSVFGVLPKGWLWPALWLALHAGSVPLVNSLKVQAGVREGRRSPYLQTHGAFHFLLDYLPRWHWMTKPGGLIQFQPFVPLAEGERVLARLIASCQLAGMVPYLGVLKRHRPDPFLMTHAVDGFSLAMDFAVSRNAAQREALWRLCREMADVVLEAGGRFYYAKDAVLEASSLARIHGAAAVATFRAMKRRLDPQGIMQSDLSRRLGL